MSKETTQTLCVVLSKMQYLYGVEPILLLHAYRYPFVKGREPAYLSNEWVVVV